MREQVTIISTTPDIFGRRLEEQQADVTVESVDFTVVFTVESTTLSAEILAKMVKTVDGTKLSVALTSALEAQGIAVVITGIQVKVRGAETVPGF